jgi:hypothetical protein
VVESALQLGRFTFLEPQNSSVVPQKPNLDGILGQQTSKDKSVLENSLATTHIQRTGSGFSVFQAPVLGVTLGLVVTTGNTVLL